MTVPPQQPGLPPVVVFDRAPAGWMPYLVTDEHTAPILRPGDVVLIDTSNREPAERDLFLIRWLDGSTDLVETWSRSGRFGSGPNGEVIDSRAWFVAAYNRPRTSAEWQARLASGAMVSGWTDGPYATEGPRAGVLARKLVGRVAGILAPVIDEPRRIISPAGGAA